jgi:integrase
MSRPAKGQVLERKGKRGRTFALRFRAYGRRLYVTLGTAEEGWTRDRAEDELANVLADVRRGIWREPVPELLVEEPREEPDFHRFATDYVNARRHELKARSVEALEWALSSHLLAVFGSYRLSAITPELVDRYKAAKVRERTEQVVKRPLSNASINKTIAVLAQVLDAAVEYGHIATNPARGRRRRLKAGKPRRTWLELDEVRALLDAGGENRALLATMVLGGLRVGELCALRWRDVDLARGTITVGESKTDAGRRVVDVSPDLLDELKTHRMASGSPEPDELVFVTRNGTARDRGNVRQRVLGSAIAAANKKLDKVGKAPIQSGVTNHTLRRTFASLLYEAGASPAYLMSQMGHTSSALALEVYARKMERERDTGARMDALIRGADWAQAGTNPLEAAEALSPEKI